MPTYLVEVAVHSTTNPKEGKIMGNLNKTIICEAEGSKNILMSGQRIFRVIINKSRIGEKRSGHFTTVREVSDWVLKCDWLETSERADIVERARKHFG